MKLMIASDIHGSAYYCRKMLAAFERERADRLLLLGDLLYHGPRNDLPKEYAPKEVIAMLNPLRENILCVRGNCDTEVDQMVLSFPIMAEYCLLELDEQTIFATHGHVWNPQNLPMLKKGDILLNGHTHIPACGRRELPGGTETAGEMRRQTAAACKEQEQGNVGGSREYIYMNPGSVSIPKEGSAHSYMIYEKGTFEWKNLEGKVYQTWKTDLHF